MEERIDEIVGAEVQPAEAPVIDEQARAAAIVKSARKIFSRIGFSSIAVLGISVGAAALLAMIIAVAAPEFTSSGTGLLVLSVVSTHLIAIPLGCLIMRRIPKVFPQPEPFGIGKLLLCVPVCVFFAYVGQLIGVLVSELLSAAAGVPYEDPTAGLAAPDIPFPVMLLCLVIVGPFMEELLFRRVLIDRMCNYGEKLAIVTSAVMFGIFHGNIEQATYATLLGLIFGYVYLRTHNIWYTFALHAFVNFYSGALIAKVTSAGGVPELLEDLAAGASAGELIEQYASDPSVLVFAAYVLFTALLFVAGLVIFIVKIRKLHFYQAPLQLPKGRGFAAAWLNPGMICFVITCIAYMCLSLAVL